jgi:hypothetical protein
MLETKQCYYVDMFFSLTMIKESPKEIMCVKEKRMEEKET